MPGVVLNKEESAQAIVAGAVLLGFLPKDTTSASVDLEIYRGNVTVEITNIRGSSSSSLSR